jgi:hypothetical protein
MDISINLIDEIAMIFFWVGANGILDKIISWPSIKPSKIYIYLLLLLSAVFFKLPNSS